MKQLIKIKSITDVITNSSTEVFLLKNDDAFKEFNDTLKLLKADYIFVYLIIIYYLCTIKIRNNMVTNLSETQLAYFELCKLLKSVGYKQGSDKFFVIHNEDYVYDEDPDHPESHKKGEISVYNRYHKNNNDDINYYELPTLEEINNWLLKEKRFYVCLTITDGRYFDYNIYTKVDSLTFGKYKLSEQGGNKCTSPDDAYINAFTRILRFLKEIRTCEYIISNSFYGCYGKENQ